MENRVTLSDILRIFFKKKALLLAVFIPIFILTAASAFLFPNYESSAVVMFSLKKRPTSIERERLDLKEGIAFIYTNVSLLKSRPVLLEVIKRLSLCKDEKKINEPEQTIQKLLKDISVEPLMFTNLVDIKVKRRNPNEAADIARTLIEVYKKWQISFLQEEIKVVSDFLDTELIKSKNRLDSAKEQLKDFKMKAGIGISDTIVAAKFEDVTQLYERIARNSADLELNQVRLSNAEEELCLKDVKVNGLAISQLAELLSDAEQVKLFERGLKDIETRMAYYLKSFTSDHPSVKGLLEQEAETKEALYHELCGVVKADKNADDSTAQLLESYLRLYTEKVVLEVIKEAFNLVARDSEDRKWNVRKDLMPDAEMEAAKMQREINLIQFFYEEEREEKELIEIARDLKDMGIVEVVSPPTISKKPKGRFLTLVFGNFFGLLISACAALIMEYRNYSFKRPHSVEADLKMPLLAVIPHVDSNGKEDAFRIKKGTVASDRFYKLASNILAVKKDSYAQLVQITSSISGEGKTFVASNLAIGAAELGYRILLIDANYRAPLVHTVFSSDVKNGFVDVLSGSISCEKAVKKSVIKGLEIITCGEEPMRAPDIFNQTNLRAVINPLKPKYDIIFIDTAAINPYTEPAIIANVADSVILVIESDRTQKESVFIAKKALEKSAVSGVVLNKMRYYIPQAVFDLLTSLKIS